MLLLYHICITLITFGLVVSNTLPKEKDSRISVSRESFIGNPSPDYECETNAYPPQEKYALPWFKLDLNTDPSHRWDEIIEVYKEEINALLEQAIHLVSFIDPSGKAIEFVDKYFPLLLAKFPKEYRAEVRGIAAKSGITVGRAVAYNIFYELFSVCTSIVAENNRTGEHFHGRNLDFGLFLGWDNMTHTWKMSEILRKMEFNVKVVRGSQPVFNMTTFGGYIGVITGVRAGHYSISLNERFAPPNGGLHGLFNWIVKNEDLYFATWLLRDVLEASYDYDEAVNELSTRGLIAPCYYIVSGVKHNQGHLITRSTNETLQPLQLSVEEGRWYLLETNYDHWKQPPFFDNRRTPGQKCMNESSTETFDKAHMFNVLSTDPNLNQLTVYTTLMNPQTGEIEAYKQYCPSCYIW